MKAEYLIFPYFVLVAAMISRAVYIRKIHILPTLKKYGRDYENYLFPTKQKLQLEEYIDLCAVNCLPDKYWRYMRIYDKIAIFLMIGWFALMIYVGKWE
jgi:hypothetical protein